MVSSPASVPPQAPGKIPVETTHEDDTESGKRTVETGTFRMSGL